MKYIRRVMSKLRKKFDLHSYLEKSRRIILYFWHKKCVNSLATLFHIYIAIPCQITEYSIYLQLIRFSTKNFRSVTEKLQVHPTILFAATRKMGTARGLTCAQKSSVTFGLVIFGLLFDCTNIVKVISEPEAKPKSLSYVLGSIRNESSFFRMQHGETNQLKRNHYKYNRKQILTTIQNRINVHKIPAEQLWRK